MISFKKTGVSRIVLVLLICILGLSIVGCVSSQSQADRLKNVTVSILNDNGEEIKLVLANDVYNINIADRDNTSLLVRHNGVLLAQYGPPLTLNSITVEQVKNIVGAAYK